MSEALVLTETAKGVRWISMNRPDALNAFIPEIFDQLNSAIDAANADPDCHCIVFQGQGKAFSAGVDLKMLQKATFRNGFVDSIFTEQQVDVSRRLRQSHKPVIAKVHGACFTGALELALHCDFILTTVDTKFGDTHAKWGLRPSWGMSQSLPRAIGVRRARQMSYSAQTIKGDLAEAWGLVNTAYPDLDTLNAETAKLAEAIAENSPGAITAYKDLFVVHENNMPLEGALSEEVARDYDSVTDTMDRLKAFGL